MMNTKKILLLLTSWISICLIGSSGLGCANTGQYQSNTTSEEILTATSDDPIYSVFLVGDAGAASVNSLEPSLQVLKSQLDKSGEESAVIFLGDNIYPSGLPPEGTRSRNRAERRLRAQLETVDEYPGRVIFIPGNHDWHSSKPKGLQRILRQEHYIEDYLQRGNTFLPDSGHPGPVAVSLNNADTSLAYDIRLIVLDTQWWLHPHSKPYSPGIRDEEKQKEKILRDLAETIRRHENDEIIVAGHHPMFSYGRHGGKFPPQTHLLPPVLGSMYIAYRNIWGYHQDIANYNDLRDGLMESFESDDGLIYASGHEHSLQFIPHQSDSTQQYYLVSGSASRSSYVKKLRGTTYTHRGKGFMAIRYFKDQSKRIEIWSEKGDVIFKRYIRSDSK